MQENPVIIAEPEVATAANEAEPPTEEAKPNSDSATAVTSKISSPNKIATPNSETVTALNHYLNRLN